ncbi:ATPase domain-containing protein [Pyrococcus sp. NA2]|uniref:ATPase domain-containing protein n=1 Tax=Pyrococcus sp. (strain NA2) TaxID=342949 RepID=UPI001ED97A60|nr:ATPase domain-containing protein [Pyrococcus sp. NA2]
MSRTIRILMKLRTGIPTLDAILEGGFEKECNIALVGGIDNDYILLAHQLISSFLSQGSRVLLVELRQDPSSLVRWLKQYGINYEGYIKEGQLKILDGFTNLYSPSSVSGPDILPNPLDLGITTAIIRDNVSREMYDIVVFDDVTSLYALQTDYRAYIRVIVRLINSIRKLGASSLVAVNSDVLSIKDLSMVLMPFEYLIEVKENVIRIKRSFSFISVPGIPYVKTSKGIVPTGDVLKDANTLRESLTVENEGTIKLGMARVQIVSESSERSLIEYVYQFLGAEKGREFLYGWGRYELERVNVTPIKGSIKELKALLEDMFEVTKTTGGGNLRIVEITENTIVIEGKDLFPKFEKFPYPVHIHYAGSMAKLLEKATGDKWIGDEVECESQSDERCVFVLKRIQE